MIKAMPKKPLPAAPAGSRGAIPIAQQTLNPGAKPITPTSPNVDYIPRPAMPSMPQRPTVGTPNAIPKTGPKGLIPFNAPMPVLKPEPNVMPKVGSMTPFVNKPLMMPAGSGVGKAPPGTMGRLAKGGKVAATSKMANGGKVSSASSRGDGCAVRGKTKGRMV